eukprot:CAMPEP_0185188564 /NCGR_PEP_ID=MMETSP1140-20130426/5483_1 /TAXON_ID=298111 /ORGANISM="Pavlova sp., Strain CCMP459" /LENGTH=691 /DNA_ID=CAMNT_0027755073 /DNA_START=369 /DNA_END=2441 /DNA_ORIENTATION=-
MTDEMYPGIGDAAQRCKLRISLVRNTGQKRAEATSVVVVPPTFDAIAAAAVGKLKLRTKDTRRIRLFLHARVGSHPAGTELSRGDCSELLCDDAIVSVSAGEGYGGRQTTGAAAQIDRRAAPPLPCLGAPNSDKHPRKVDRRPAHGEDAEGSSTTSGEASPVDVPSPSAPCAPTDGALGREAEPRSFEHHTRARVSEHLEMRGAFPVFEGNVLPLLREAIAGCHEFTSLDVGEYICFDYHSERGGAACAQAMWPEVEAARRGTRERWMRAARRECRGLLVSARTGRVLARRFHKFFNADEVEETTAWRLEDQLNSAGARATVSLKVDGSLCSPLLLPRRGLCGGEMEAATPSGAASDELVVVWATRCHLSPSVAAHVRSTLRATADATGGSGGGGAGGGIDYAGFARAMMDRGVTPLFEWCSSGHAPGVVRHMKDHLVLLALRDMRTGQYAVEVDTIAAVAAPFCVPVAAAGPPSHLEDLASVVARAGPGAAGEDAGVVAELQRRVRGVEGVEGVVVAITISRANHEGSTPDGVGAPPGAATPADTALPPSSAGNAVSAARGADVAAPDVDDALAAAMCRCQSTGLESRPVQSQTLVKMKTAWWLSMCDASKRSRGRPVLPSLLRVRPTLSAVPPEAIFAACLHASSDDVLAACFAQLREAGALAQEARLRSFAPALKERIANLAARLERW